MHPGHDLGPSLHTCLSNSLAYETLYMGRHTLLVYGMSLHRVYSRKRDSFVSVLLLLHPFLPSFFSSRGNFSHETYLVRFVANPKSYRIHHPKFCLPSVFFLSIRKKGERERESWKREIFFNWYHVACINIVRVNHKYLTICSFDERMIHKHAVFFAPLLPSSCFRKGRITGLPEETRSISNL